MTTIQTLKNLIASCLADEVKCRTLRTEAEKTLANITARHAWHNPHEVRPKLVDPANEGWRLCLETELSRPPADVQIWRKGAWGERENVFIGEKLCTLDTYRTKAEIPDPFAELKKAHAEGKTIQTLDMHRWTDVVSPKWSVDPKFYRIKPELRTVQLTRDDIPPVCWVRRAPGHAAHLICAVYGDMVGVYGEMNVSYYNLMREGWEYSDDLRKWEPCHKPS
jgi:hypothetical protein